MNNVMYHGDNYKNINVVGEKILIKKMKDVDDIMNYDGIYYKIDKKAQNNIMGCGEVLDVTPETSKEHGVYVGDYVLYDYWSAFGDSKDTIITNAENLILKVTKDEAEEFSKRL